MPISRPVGPLERAESDAPHNQVSRESLLERAVRWIKGNPAISLSTICGRAWIWVVYSTETAPLTPIPPSSDRILRPLAARELKEYTAGSEGEGRQLQRLKRFGRSHAYGVFLHDRLAHIAWFLPAPVDQLDVPRVLALAQDEAEITACETAPELRGRGAYSFAIESLVRVAREMGIGRVYMKTAPRNRASIAGIRKAGLAYHGAVLIWNPPWKSTRRLALALGRVPVARSAAITETNM